MSTIEEIEDAVRRLSSAELAAFRAWFGELDAAAWDRQIEEVVAAARLDALADEALNDLRPTEMGPQLARVGTQRGHKEMTCPCAHLGARGRTGRPGQGRR
jgi:hypothetical protein